jgi:hypothetical protein
VLDGGATEAGSPLGPGRPYFVMELVRGAPITRFCDEQCMSVRERLALLIDACHAVQHAHQKGIIHRDLPETGPWTYAAPHAWRPPCAPSAKRRGSTACSPRCARTSRWRRISTSSNGAVPICAALAALTAAIGDEELLARFDPMNDPLS